MAESTRRQQIEAMLASDPTDAFLRYALAMEYVSAGEDDRAIAEFKRLVHEHPRYVAGYHQCGQAFARQNLPVEAREILDRGIRVATQCGEMHAAEEMTGLLQNLEG